MKNSVACKDCPSRNQGIFCAIGSEELSEVSKHKVSNVYKKGQNLFIQGNHPFGIFCISSGNIKVTQTGADGKESIIRIVKGGDILGHRSLFTSEHYRATATAMEDTKACFLDKSFIMKTIENNPSVSLNIIEKLSKDMGAAESWSSSLHQKNVRERLAELLLLLKESHGSQIEEKKTMIDLKLTREEMATMVGTASETVIRFISEFKNEGIIEQEGKKIVIIDEEKLLDWANLPY